MNGLGFENRNLTDAEAAEVVAKACAGWNVDGKRVLCVIPDGTRTCPLGLMFRLVYAQLAPRTKLFDFMIALGTHVPMTEEQIYQRVEITPEEHKTKYAKARFFNHAWDDASQLTKVGAFTKKEISDLTEGRFALDIDVTCNKAVRDYDMVLIIGPVFPHEVVGMSGGNKYLFPGISGPDVLNFFHWLGAVITNPVIIGNKWTPVRAVVDRCGQMVPCERRALCMVVQHGGLAGLYHGTPEEAWSSAADLSAKLHIVLTPRTYHTVLSCAPKMYDELWVGAKCMYKLEPALADGAKLIIYAPHLHEVSVVHGKLIEEIGYHTRDYFVKQWDKFKHIAWGTLAHSTHVKGIGTYENGIEKPRVEVILATGIPEATCKKINLGYMDWRSINVADYQNREAEGILHVPKAGEMLYRYQNAPPELGGKG